MLYCIIYFKFSIVFSFFIILIYLLFNEIFIYSLSSIAKKNHCMRARFTSRASDGATFE